MHTGVAEMAGVAACQGVELPSRGLGRGGGAAQPALPPVTGPGAHQLGGGPVERVQRPGVARLGGAAKREEALNRQVRRVRAARACSSSVPSPGRAAAAR